VSERSGGKGDIKLREGQASTRELPLGSLKSSIRATLKKVIEENNNNKGRRDYKRGESLGVREEKALRKPKE